MVSALGVPMAQNGFGGGQLRVIILLQFKLKVYQILKCNAIFQVPYCYALWLICE